MNRIRIFWGTLLLLVAIFATANADDDTGHNPCPLTAPDKAFLASLQQAVAKDDIDWIADRIDCPILVYLKGKLRRIRNK